MTNLNFNVAISELVTQGRVNTGVYNAGVKKVNLLSAERVWNVRSPKWVKGFRLKEWQAFQLWTDDCFIFGAVYNAKLIGVSLLSVYHILTGEIWHNTKIAPPGKLNVANGLACSETSYESNNLGLLFFNELDNDQVKITAHSQIGNVRLDVQCDHKVEPMVVCLPLGCNKAMYSHKAIMPISGFLELNNKKIALNAQNSQCIIDDHKGFYPYNLSYDWELLVGEIMVHYMD